MAMADSKTAALMGVLGKSSPTSGMAEDMNAEGGDYDADLRTAIDDFAAALGVTVKDPGRAVDAVRAMHDLCARASAPTGGE